MSKPDHLTPLQRELTVIPRQRVSFAEVIHVQSGHGSRMINLISQRADCWFDRWRRTSLINRQPRLQVLILDRLSSAERDQFRRGAAFLRETWSRTYGLAANDIELVALWSVRGPPPPLAYTDCGHHCRLVNLSAHHLVIAGDSEATSDVVLAARPTLGLESRSVQAKVIDLLAGAPGCWGIIALPGDINKGPGDLPDEFAIGPGLEISRAIAARRGAHLFHRLSPLFL